MNEEKNWYVVYTKSRWEKKVAENLTRAEIENYLPLRKEKVQWSDRKKEVEKIIIPSYVFVKINEQEQTSVRMINGVVNFVYWLKKPAIVKNNEVEKLKQFLENEGIISIEKLEAKIGNVIEIEDGIFKGQKGKIVKVKEHKIELILECLNIKLVIKKK